MPLESGLLEILACPACHAPLKEQELASQGGAAPQESGASQAGEAPQAGEASQASEAPLDSELLCTGRDCGLAYPVRDGIPVLLVDEARRPA